MAAAAADHKVGKAGMVVPVADRDEKARDPQELAALTAEMAAPEGLLAA